MERERETCVFDTKKLWPSSDIVSHFIMGIRLYLCIWCFVSRLYRILIGFSSFFFVFFLLFCCIFFRVIFLAFYFDWFSFMPFIWYSCFMCMYVHFFFLSCFTLFFVMKFVCLYTKNVVDLLWICFDLYEFLAKWNAYDIIEVEAIQYDFSTHEWMGFNLTEKHIFHLYIFRNRWQYMRQTTCSNFNER